MAMGFTTSGSEANNERWNPAGTCARFIDSAGESGCWIFGTGCFVS
jgi:hypothetical protein